MTRKKTLKDSTGDVLQSELAALFADQHYRPCMTMSQKELAVWGANGIENPVALRALTALLGRLTLEAPTGQYSKKATEQQGGAITGRPRVRCARSVGSGRHTRGSLR